MLLTHLELREFETSAKKSAAEHGRMKDLLDVKTYMHALPPPKNVILAMVFNFCKIREVPSLVLTNLNIPQEREPQ